MSYPLLKLSPYDCQWKRWLEIWARCFSSEDLIEFAGHRHTHCVRTLRVRVCYSWAGKPIWDLIKGIIISAAIWLWHPILKICLCEHSYTWRILNDVGNLKLAATGCGQKRGENGQFCAACDWWSEDNRLAGSVFFCKPAPSSCLRSSEGNKDLRVGNDNRQQQQLRREVCLSIHCWQQWENRLRELSDKLGRRVKVLTRSLAWGLREASPKIGGKFYDLVPNCRYQPPTHENSQR